MTFYRDFCFFIQEAIIGIRRSLLMMFILVATIMVSLCVFGLFLMLVVNMSHLADFLTSKLEMRIYLKEDISKNNMINFSKKLMSLSQISDVDFIHRDVAWSSFKKQYPNMKMSEIIEDNPLPHSFRVYLKHSEKISELAYYIKSYRAYVEDVSYGGKIADRLDVVTRYIQFGGIILVSLCSQ